MASGSGQYPAGRAPAPTAPALFARTFFFASPTMAPVQPMVPAVNFFVPQGPPPAFLAPPPQPQMPVAPFRFITSPGLPPLPPRMPPPRQVADMIGMVPLEPNHAFWAPYRSGGGRPVELDFLGLFAGPALPDPDDNTSVASSPSFKDWIREDDDSSEDMQTESNMN